MAIKNLWNLIFHTEQDNYDDNILLAYGDCGATYRHDEIRII